MKKITIYLMLLSACVCLISCKKKEIDIHPANYEQLSELIGETHTDVCEKLNVAEESMEEVVIGLYKTPIKVEYLDDSYDELLEFDAHTNEMYGFIYQQTFSNDDGNVNKEITELLDDLIKLHGKPDTFESLSARLLGENVIEEKLQKEEVFSAYEVWKIADDLEMYLKVSADGKTNVTIQIEYKAK